MIILHKRLTRIPLLKQRCGNKKKMKRRSSIAARVWPKRIAVTALTASISEDQDLALVQIASIASGRTWRLFITFVLGSRERNERDPAASRSYRISLIRSSTIGYK